MFFISWGSRAFQRLFGTPEQHYCEICKEDRTFRNIVYYKIFHIMWLFRWVVQKSYARACTVCRNGPSLPASQFEGKGAASPIPFIDRMGWSIGVGGIAALGVMGFVASSHQDKLDEAALAQPAAGDVYEVDLAKMETHPEAPEMYSTLLVTQVSPDGVQVRLPKTYFNRLSGILPLISNHVANSPNFYGDRTMTFSLTTLQKMRKDGVIMEVER